MAPFGCSLYLEIIKNYVLQLRNKKIGRSGITYEEVVDAAEKLLGLNETPTINKVRYHLGDTGSNSNISRHLKNWKDERLKINPEERHKNMPNTVHEAIGDFWDMLRQESQAENERLQREAADAITLAKEAQLIAEKSFQDQSDLLQKEQLKINHLQNDLKILRDEFTQENKKSIRLEAQLSQKEQSLNDLREETEKRLKAMAVAYEETVTHLKTQLEKNRKDV